MPESISTESRRTFRNRLLLSLLVFICIPVSAYLDTLMLKHDQRMNLIGFILEFGFFFMILGYASIKFTYFIARQRFGEVEISEQKARDEKIQKQLEPRKAEFERTNYGNRVFGCLIIVLGPLFVIIGGALGVGFFNKPQLGAELGIFVGISLAGYISSKLTDRKFDKTPISNIPDRTKSIFNVVGLSLYWEFYLLWMITGLRWKIHRMVTHNFDLWQLNIVIVMGFLLPLVLAVCTQAYRKSKSATLLRFPLIVLVLIPTVTKIVYELGMYIAVH